MKTCADVIHHCVVLGHQRVCPLLVAELLPSTCTATEEELLSTKTTILSRTAAFNERLFPHERITKAECILLVSSGSLPRTSVGALLPEHHRSRDVNRPFRLIGKGQRKVSNVLAVPFHV